MLQLQKTILNQIKIPYSSGLHHFFSSINNDDILTGNSITSASKIIHEDRFTNPMELETLKVASATLRKEISKTIDQNQAISFARYMELALTHDPEGYYMKRDVFNKKGDFITSPEISQMFGECLGVWVTLFFQKLIEHDKTFTDNGFSLLEFGPGKGTLMKDILRTLAQFDQLHNLHVNFVEASPFLQKVQQENIQEQMKALGIYLIFDDKGERNKTPGLDERLNSCVTMETYDSEFNGKPIHMKFNWYTSYEGYVADNFQNLALETLKATDSTNALTKPILILCHEFFDAMPAMIFEYSKMGWVEKLVDKMPPDMVSESKKMFQLVDSEVNNKNVKNILNPYISFDEESRSEIQVGDRIEVQPKSMILMNSFAELISKVGGGVLAIDYGEDHAFSDSIRGISNHKYIEKLEDLLEVPGEADISAYVNFMALADVAEDVPGIEAAHTMTQGDFLNMLGIQQRLEVLKQTPGVDRALLDSQVERLTDYDQMGEIYKVQYIGNRKCGEVFPFISPGNLIYQ